MTLLDSGARKRRNRLRLLFAPTVALALGLIVLKELLGPGQLGTISIALAAAIAVSLALMVAQAFHSVYSAKTAKQLLLESQAKYKTRSELTDADHAAKSDLLEITLAHMNQGITFVDSKGDILIFNKQAVEYAGIDDEAFVLPANVRDIFRAQLEIGEFGPGGELLPIEVRNFLMRGIGEMPKSYVRRRPNGTVLEVRTERLPSGGMVQSYTDITELVRAKEAAEAGARAKSIFLATMSHEIRTPLNGVLGMASLLREGRLTQEQRRNVDAITSCGDALLHIINDILDLSKLEAGMMEIEDAPFDLPALINSAMNVTRGAATNKGINIEVQMDPDLPRIVRGDRNRLRQALLNLLSNAVKFTAAGKVVLRATLTPANQLRIEVADTGIGIPDEARDRLFKEFSQVDASISRRFGGTGLGLAITQRIVQAMNGQIGVESEPGKGSCFWFELPIVAAPDAVLPEPPTKEKRALPVPVSAIAVDGDSLPVAARSAGGWRILVAEDMAVNQMVARGLLEARGHSVDVAADGAEAIAKAEEDDYDLILMDMQMPRMDGLEATRMIRARGGKLARIPIVAMTANAFGSDEAACIEAGMNDFIAKPIDAEKLDDTLNRVMSGRSAAATQARDIARVFNPAPLDALRQQLGAAAVEDVIECCKLEVPPLLGRVESCVAHGDIGELGDLLSALGSALSNLGFVAAANYCRAQSQQFAGGEPPEPDLAKVLERLVGEGWRR